MQPKRSRRSSSSLFPENAVEQMAWSPSPRQNGEKEGMRARTSRSSRVFIPGGERQLMTTSLLYFCLSRKRKAAPKLNPRPLLPQQVLLAIQHHHISEQRDR